MDKLSNNESPIMGNCLSCQGLVRVPATAPTSSTVRCPHCDESFLLSQILNDAVPELKIVEEEDQNEEVADDDGSAKDADGRFVVANQLRQSSKKSRRGRRRSRSRRPEEAEGMVPVPKPLTEEPDFSSASHDRETDTSQFSVSDSENQSPRESFDSRRSSGSSGRRSSSDSSRSRSSSRNRSSNKSSGGNAAVEIFKVVLGGALAIPIAYLLVLWVFRQDPLHVAPKIVQTAPFLVPAEFHDTAEETEDSDDSESESEPVVNPLVEEILDVSDGLPKPFRDPSKVGIN